MSNSAFNICGCIPSNSSIPEEVLTLSEAATLALADINSFTGLNSVNNPTEFNDFLQEMEDALNLHVPKQPGISSHNHERLLIHAFLSKLTSKNARIFVDCHARKWADDHGNMSYKSFREELVKRFRTEEDHHVIKNMLDSLTLVECGSVAAVEDEIQQLTARYMKALPTDPNSVHTDGKDFMHQQIAREAATSALGNDIMRHLHLYGDPTSFTAIIKQAKSYEKKQRRLNADQIFNQSKVHSVLTNQQGESSPVEHQNSTNCNTRRHGNRSRNSRGHRSKRYRRRYRHESQSNEWENKEYHNGVWQYNRPPHNTSSQQYHQEDNWSHLYHEPQPPKPHPQPLNIPHNNCPNPQNSTDPTQPYIHVMLNNSHTFYALADTGATVSGISLRAAKASGIIDKCKPSNVPTIQGVAGSKVNILGEVTCTLKYVGHSQIFHINLQIIEGLKQDIIIGNDHIKQEKLTLCARDDTIYSKDQMSYIAPIIWSCKPPLCPDKPSPPPPQQMHTGSQEQNNEHHEYNPDIYINSINMIEETTDTNQTLYDNSCKSPACIILRTSEKIEIPPASQWNSFITTPPEVANCFMGEDVMIEPLQSQTQHQSLALVAREITTIKPLIPIQIMNPSSSKLIIEKDTAIATVESMAQHHEICIIEPEENNHIINEHTHQMTSLSSDDPPSQILPESTAEKMLNSILLDHPWISDMDIDEDLTVTQKLQLVQLLKDYEPAFSIHDEDIGRSHLLKFKINTTDEIPVRTRNYPMAQSRKEFLQKEIKRFEKLGIIEKSTSPYNSPLVLVRKNGDTYRVCVDYRKLNSKTHGEITAIATVTEMIDQLAGNHYYTSVDLFNGFHQMEIDPECREKTAFTANGQHYQYKTLPLGLKNASLGFSRLMDIVLGDLQFKSALLYIDDCLIFSKTFEQHLQRLADVLQRLVEANLKIKPAKCSMLKSSIEFLGFTITRDGVLPSKKKGCCYP